MSITIGFIFAGVGIAELFGFSSLLLCMAMACRAVQELSITFPPKTVLSIILGTAITTFGIYNIHQQADITEGGLKEFLAQETKAQGIA